MALPAHLQMVGLVLQQRVRTDADGWGHTADAGNLWTFNYFFYNKKSKRIVYFSCRSRSKHGGKQSPSSSDSEREDDMYADDDFADGMEI
jgi:hypothetical protein